MADGTTLTANPSMTFAALEGNTSLEMLALDLKAAIDASLGSNAGILDVTRFTDPAAGIDTLRIAATTGRVSSVRVVSSGIGSFNAGQVSAQTGARLYFTATTASTGKVSLSKHVPSASTA
jgi:hypothetical protein